MDVVDIQLAQPLLCFFQQFGNALHGIDLLDERRQHGRLVATAGAYLEYSFALESLEQRLGHLGNDIRLTDCLSQSERQRRIFISTARQRLIDEQVTRHIADLFQNLAGSYAGLLETTDQPVTRTRRCHSDAADVLILNHHLLSHSPICGNTPCQVRSTLSGVTDTAP